MNGVHDLGGMHGFGPINPEPEAEEPVFHAEWEKRVFGFTRAAGFLGKWNIDMSRHSRERQHPVDYLRHTYYENWLAGLGTLLVESGLITSEELATGKASGLADKTTRKLVPKAKDIAGILAKGNPVMMDIDTPARFKTGDKVRAINQHPKGHTRQPQYVRGHVGTIHEHHGAHIFPDKNSEGTTEGHHLYSVRFEAETLWGKDAVNRGAVYVDLWEDYLEPVK